LLPSQLPELIGFVQVEVYEELARIFSEENNQSAQRELLMKECTAKFAETAGENDRQMLKVIQKQASYSNVCIPRRRHLHLLFLRLTNNQSKLNWIITVN